MKFKFKQNQYLIIRLIDNERPKVQPRVFGWTDYGTWEQIYEWMDQINNRFPAMSIVHIGNSFQGRPIRAAKISYKQVRLHCEPWNGIPESYLSLEHTVSRHFFKVVEKLVRDLKIMRIKFLNKYKRRKTPGMICKNWLIIRRMSICHF